MLRTGPQWARDFEAGRRLRNLRTAAGLSKAEVTRRMRAAGFTNWHRPTLGRLEGGERHFQLAEVEELARILDVGPREITTGSTWRQRRKETP